MQISQNGIDLIKYNEGIRYKAYKDSKGLDTTGCGHLITSKDSYLLSKILTDNEVNSLLLGDIKPCEAWLNDNCDDMAQNVFDGLCSFLFQYNIDKYPGTKQAIISGNIPDIVAHLNQFCNIVAGSGDNKLASRRKREIDLITTGKWTK
jgi:GH24 family phage-related lysozyme (muramidase)